MVGIEGPPHRPDRAEHASTDGCPAGATGEGPPLPAREIAALWQGSRCRGRSVLRGTVALRCRAALALAASSAGASWGAALSLPAASGRIRLLGLLGLGLLGLLELLVPGQELLTVGRNLFLAAGHLGQLLEGGRVQLPAPLDAIAGHERLAEAPKGRTGGRARARGAGDPARPRRLGAGTAAVGGARGRRR